MAPSNKAAYIPAAQAHPMEVREAEYPKAGDGELIVKVAAIAVNPMDWYIQIMGNQLFSFLQYPYVGGDDLAGTVVEVGPNVTKFKAGDRVLGLAPGFDAREGAFQEFVVLKTQATTHIPDDLSFNEASVLPLGIATAAAALYQKTQLGLTLPSLSPKPAGETLLIWAGASSVGTNTIQLAVASGYEVYTTSSPHNFEYCKSLGASKVFDYKSPTVTQEILDAFKGKKCAGAVAIQMGAEGPCFEVVAKAEGTKKFVACAMPVPEDKVPEGVGARMVFAGTIMQEELGEFLYTEYLPAALAQKKFRCLPEPLVVGHGLEKLQEALDKGKSGAVSAKKMVITL